MVCGRAPESADGCPVLLAWRAQRGSVCEVGLCCHGALSGCLGALERREGTLFTRDLDAPLERDAALDLALGGEWPHALVLKVMRLVGWSPDGQAAGRSGPVRSVSASGDV